MAIKMRINKNAECICEECGSKRKDSLDMYDLCIAGEIVTICDACNDALFNKVLKASIHTQARIKSNEDIKVMNSRRMLERKNEKYLSVAEALKGEK